METRISATTGGGADEPAHDDARASARVAAQHAHEQPRPGDTGGARVHDAALAQANDHRVAQAGDAALAQARDHRVALAGDASIAQAHDHRIAPAHDAPAQGQDHRTSRAPDAARDHRAAQHDRVAPGHDGPLATLARHAPTTARGGSSAHDRETSRHDAVTRAARSPAGSARTAHVEDARTPIIAFAKDWHEDPTSNHHVLRELAKTRRVLWLNSLATRTPSLGSARDLGKIKRKLREFATGPVNVEHDLWVFSPLVLPLPHAAWARAINQRLLRATVRLLRARLGIERFQLWTFLPSTADYVGTLGEDASVYYCVDEWSLFRYLDHDATVAAERALLRKVDAVFAVNDELAAAKRATNAATFVAPHGVDHALFARALDDATPVPADIAAIARPRIGFYGTLRDWVDLELIAHVARARPAWQLVLLGQVLTDVSALRGLPNVHLLGQKPHGELPAYCKAFDVGIIPYRVEDRSPYVNPLKLREYLSAGLPVVSTPMAEVERYRDLCRIAAQPDAFVAAIEAALREGGPRERGVRSAAMKHETWSARVADVIGIVNEISQRKHT